MKKISILFLALSIFLLFCLAGNSFSLEIETPDKVHEEYIIQKGDTLWGISNAKLGDTFLWPRLWNFNPHISNPDLIYPGLKIRIPSREELMRLPFVSGPEAVPEPEAAPEPEQIAEPELPAVPEPKPVRKLKPRPEPEPEIVLEAPAPPKYILSKNLFITSGWISKEYPSVGEITGTPMGREMVGSNDMVYIRISRSNKPSDIQTALPQAQLIVENAKQRFYSIRRIKKVNHPETGKRLGYQIRITGILEVSGADSDTPKARLIESFEDVQVGDGLMPFRDLVPPTVPDKARTPDINGFIVESKLNADMVRRGDIAYLDKGEKDGLRPGDIFTAISGTKVKRSIGTLQIISLQPDTS
ncbi:MAG: LysM peptidoglycan-binding domain-containing protein, partial [Nitrospirota bacterium]|nr:LysM peptidoglycan-binding domain-containing protein [Nitrospirota bacterium]